MTSDSDQSKDRVDKILNVNIGILGHVDSGKTSLAKALSTLASTAAFDKNPQSKERGITLDLGFSAFYETEELPQRVRDRGFTKLQYTLVDCPGHASLIRTIMGGAQIIDVMVLVIDVTKGVQTQTAECIVIGEICTNDLIVVLNKIDQLPADSRQEKIEKMSRNLLDKVFRTTKFGRTGSIKFVPVCANPPDDQQELKQKGIRELIREFSNHVRLPEERLVADPDEDGHLLFSVDHCFPIKGKGTVLTGTVLRGSLDVNQTIEIAALNEQRKVKSIQMFHKPAQHAAKGDRAGVLVTQFNSELLERGLVCEPGAVKLISSIIAKVDRIKFYKGDVKSKMKFHVSVGHTTVMGVPLFFTPEDGQMLDRFDPSKNYVYVEQLAEIDPASETASQQSRSYFAKIDFETPVPCYNGAKFIASRLDTDINVNQIRLAFHGVLYMNWAIFASQSSSAIAAAEAALQQLKIYKHKLRTASVDRIVDDYTIIGNYLSKKRNAKITTNDVLPYIGKKIELRPKDPSALDDADENEGEGSTPSEQASSALQSKPAPVDPAPGAAHKALVGVIDSPFGSTGKFKVVFKQKISEFLPPPAPAPKPAEGKRKKKPKPQAFFALPFKVNMFDKDKKWIQD